MQKNSHSYSSEIQFMLGWPVPAYRLNHVSFSNYIIIGDMKWERDFLPLSVDVCVLWGRESQESIVRGYVRKLFSL
jgi:hypothetical protein